LEDVIVHPNRPPLALLAREGDPSPAFAVAVSSEGLLPARAPELTVALTTLLEERLRPTWPAIEARPGWEGFVLRGLTSEGALDALFVALERALKLPVAEPELDAIRRRLASLAKKPLPDGPLRDLARCRGEAFAVSARPTELTAAELEVFRAASLGTARIALAVVGPAPTTQRAVAALDRIGPMSSGARGEAAASKPPATAFVESPILPPRSLRAHVIVRSTDPVPAIAVARDLGSPTSPLLARLGGLDGAPRVDEVTAAASLGGGCLAIGLDFGAVDLAAPASASRIATAVSLVTQETVQELSEAPTTRAFGRVIARQAADPREAAERAAWWTLVGSRNPALVQPAEANPHAIVVASPPKEKPTPEGAAQAIEAAVARVSAAFEKPVVVSKTRIEQGQAELWLLLTSPCGTGAEVSTDAGFAAAFAVVSAEPRTSAASVALEPWVTPDAIGVVAHAPPLPGETPLAQARRIADAAGRSFAADPLDERSVARVRATLRARSTDPRARALFTLADALSPGHPSWIFAEGNPDALARVSVGNLAARASALREGPLRAAILANADEPQANAAAQALDRWVARRPEGVRACPTPNAASIAAPRAGTYTIEANGVSEAYVAFFVPESAREGADWLADTLDGDGGLLANAIIGAGLGKSASARIVGGAFASALVLHVASTEGALDSAVAQVRALVDRLRRGAITDAEIAHAAARRAAGDGRKSLDPRARLASLLDRAPQRPPRTAPPSAAALVAAAQAILRDETTVIVALRPPRTRAQ
jgi:hypothetical protein